MKISSEEKLATLFDALFDNKTKQEVGLFQHVLFARDNSEFVSWVIEQQGIKALELLSPIAAMVASKDLKQGFASFLTQYLSAEFFPEISEPATTAGLKLDDFAKDYQSQAAIMSGLRSVRRRFACIIAILEMNHLISNQEAIGCLSLIAEKMIQIAYQWSYASLSGSFGTPILSDGNPASLLVLAMGKLGGKELNFSSDIDLIFFYSEEGETQGGRRPLSHTQFFNRVGVLLIKLLDQVTAEGFVYRVDMRLRPYGDSGNLVMSVAQAEDYYQEQGRDWERFAMVRARLITGSQQEQQGLLAIIKAFSFRRYIDYGVIDSLRNMKQMIQQEVRRRGLKDNIKLGAGGIREIEFMVQSLQLIRGGRAPQLQEASVVEVIPLIVKENLLQQELADILISNYQFLRQLENFLQMFEEKQTQKLPEDKTTQEKLCRLMGYNDWQTFYQYLQQLLAENHHHFKELFGESEKPQDSIESFYLPLSQGLLEPEELQAKLSLESRSLAQVICKQIEDFLKSHIVKNISTRGAKRLKAILPLLLEKVLEKEQPLEALKSLLMVLRAILRRTAYLDLLFENKPVLDHLVDLVSRSHWITKRLAEFPILLDELLYPNNLYQPLEKAALKDELTQKLLRIDEQDEELILDTLREFKQTNELRVAAALISHSIDIEQVGLFLSYIAETLLDYIYPYSVKKLLNKFSDSQTLEATNHQKLIQSIGFTIIAYGKLGGRELGFNSDLDLVFLFDQSLTKMEIKDFRFYTRLAQKIIHCLSVNTRLGVLYEVDMRLRPSGNSGLLVSHIEAFEDYQNNDAWTWEHQALVRARSLVGHRSLSQNFERVRQLVITKPRDIHQLKTDVSQMREKMRQQLDQTAADKIDLKQSPGGLVDIEFIVQFLTLAYSDAQTTGHIDKPIPTANTRLIDMLKEIDEIDSKALTLLKESYRLFLNTINQATILNPDLCDKDDPLAKARKSVWTFWQTIF